MFYVFNYPNFYIGDKIEPKKFVQTLDELDGGYCFFEHDPLEQYCDYYVIKQEDNSFAVYDYNRSHHYGVEDKEFYLKSFYKNKKGAEDFVISMLENDPSLDNHCLLICRSKEELLKRLTNEHEKGLFDDCYDEEDTAYMHKLYSEIVEYIKALED